jgi:hypothetical protein
MKLGRACSNLPVIRIMPALCHQAHEEMMRWSSGPRMLRGALPWPEVRDGRVAPAARGSLIAEHDIPAGTKLRIVAWRQELDGTQWLALSVEPLDLRRP